MCALVLFRQPILEKESCELKIALYRSKLLVAEGLANTYIQVL